METFYNWLKQRKDQGNGDRKVTLVYGDSIFNYKKARIKPRPYGYSGHYMATLIDEKKPEYYEIDYLLRFIEEEFLRNYYVTCEGMVQDPYDDRLAYKLEVSDMLDVRVKASNSHYGIKPKIPAYINPLPIDQMSADDCFSLRKELSRIALDGVWDSKKRLEIKKVTLNGPATVIEWKDGTKTVVKCDKDDVLDYEKGILYAALKKLCNKKEYNDILRAIDAWNEFNKPLSELFPDLVEVEKPETNKREYKYQKCPVCGNGYNLNWPRMNKLNKQKFVDIRCSKCDTLFRVKGNPYTVTKWWTKLEHEVLKKGNQEPTNQCDNVEVEKPKKKVYKRKFGDSDHRCPYCDQNWIWSNNRRLSFFRNGFINITCRNCGRRFKYLKGGKYESE